MARYKYMDNQARIAAFMEKHGNVVKVRNPYRVKKILFIPNGCHPNLPVFLTTNRKPDGSINYSCQCACDRWCTTGCTTEEEAIEKYENMTASDSYRTKKASDQWQRIVEIVEDYWFKEPEEEYVRFDMYFRKANGEEQEKRIVWTSEAYKEKHKNDPFPPLRRAKDLFEEMEK